MTNVNNVNGQSMVNSKEVRDSQLAALESKLQDLRESHIWESTGGKFETVFRDYMTRKQVAEFFGVADRRTIGYFLKEETNGSENEKRQELIDAGVLIGKNHADIMEMKQNFMSSVTRHENSIPNDVSSTYKFHSGGETLWSLRAVVKLGMFMDRTDSAKLFRDAIINELQAGVTFKKAYQSTVQSYLQQMELSAQQGHIFNIGILNNVMDNIAVTSKLCYKQE